MARPPPLDAAWFWPETYNGAMASSESGSAVTAGIRQGWTRAGVDAHDENENRDHERWSRVPAHACYEVSPAYNLPRHAVPEPRGRTED